MDGKGLEFLSEAKLLLSESKALLCQERGAW